MFGGTGIYVGERMFALEADGQLYLKADRATLPDFKAEGSEPFTYISKNDRRSTMSYWRVPDRLLDDGQELAEWARKALAAAERSVKK